MAAPCVGRCRYRKRRKQFLVDTTRDIPATKIRERYARGTETLSRRSIPSTIARCAGDSREFRGLLRICSGMPASNPQYGFTPAWVTPKIRGAHQNGRYFISRSGSRYRMLSSISSASRFASARSRDPRLAVNSSTAV
jgi:hypothetical protein